MQIRIWLRRREEVEREGKGEFSFDFFSLFSFLDPEKGEGELSMGFGV